MLGGKIKALRLGRGLTQQQLADKLNINRSTISNYENGNREPRLNELAAIAEALGVSTDMFGIVAKDEIFELTQRAKAVFENPEIDKTTKEEIYKELMRMYLSL
jgi:transcriptional regulator with XRE-family HTH domain